MDLKTLLTMEWGLVFLVGQVELLLFFFWPFFIVFSYYVSMNSNSAVTVTVAIAVLFIIRLHPFFF